jgi:hypothetical protein
MGLISYEDISLRTNLYFDHFIVQMNSKIVNSYLNLRAYFSYILSLLICLTHHVGFHFKNTATLSRAESLLLKFACREIVKRNFFPWRPKIKQFYKLKILFYGMKLHNKKKHGIFIYATQTHTLIWAQFLFCGATAPLGPRPNSLLRFIHQTQLDMYTPGTTPMNEWSTRRRGRYLHIIQHTEETKFKALYGI